MLRLITCVFLGLMLSACSLFEGKEEVIFDDVVGPKTELLARQLPGDLRGDEENSNHTAQRKGQGLTDEKPGGGGQ